ncbi:UDP-N-acetylmuramoyl-tripeptide--D-alanyl-D-alanine ligase [Spirochaetia bacterium]|nr:UDP-N-acetylmuramoyl-tripeptide--D-alanyl-D-alanine ligase [Spirochaetia bacterium]
MNFEPSILKIQPKVPLLMDFAALCGAVNGRRISPAGKICFSGNAGLRGFSSVSIDSRRVKPGALFIALAGFVQDGHRYVEAAFKAGAVCALADESKLEDKGLHLAETAAQYGAELIAVKDTLRGLQDAACAYLEQFPNLIKIGITGSAGKTTTKEIAAAMIGREKSVVMNQGNLNSETGLPLSVFEVRPQHEVGIFELGMNRRGEIGELARVLKPCIALITNIGSAHIGILGSKGAIAEEKKNIFAEFSGTEIALIPSDDEYREFLAEDVKGTVRFYGTGAGVSGGMTDLESVRDLGLEGSEIIWAGEKVRFSLPGKHMLRNAIAAAAIAREVPVSNRAIREGLTSVKPLFGRGEILEGPVTVIQDCYNANPESTAEAVGFCDDLKYEGRKIYVMGSMLELGDASKEAHRELGQRLAVSSADMIFLYGEEMKAAAEAFAAAAGIKDGRRSISVFHTNSITELSGALEDFVEDGDLVLLKGSRICALERLIGVLMGETASAKRTLVKGAV